MTKYTFELKLEVVRAVFSEDISMREVARRYNVDFSRVRQWVDAYRVHGDSGISRKAKTSYSAQFKLSVIEDIRENGISFRQAAAKYNIRAENTIAKWMQVFSEHGAAVFLQEKRGGKRLDRPLEIKGGSGEDVEDILAENMRLKMENEYLKKLSALVRGKGTRARGCKSFGS